MFTTVRSRVAVVVGLVALLFGLAAWFGSLGPAPELGSYPSETHLAADYERYLGERVTVDGRVVDTAPVTIVAEYGAGGHVRLTITDLSMDVTEGERLRVHGVAERDYTVRAIDAISVPQSGRWYAWTVSFLAGLWVLGRLVRYWRLDTAEWTLRPRESPLTTPVLDRLRSNSYHRRDP